MTISVATNLAYVVAGLLVAWDHPAYGASLVALGVASAGFHAGWGLRWQAADECGMYVALAFLASLWGVPFPLAFVAAAVLVAQHQRISSFTWVPILVAVNVVLVALERPALALALAALAGVAFAVRQYGEREGGTTEDTAHGAWHILTAIALWLAA